ncbi:MAG: ATP-dependent helicase C-terminal domain-containing protein, partial [Bdellovibrionota bacterium]
DSLNAALARLPSKSERPLKVFPLYSQLADIDIQCALESRAGERKILLATNIAESSLTLDGLTSVVDTGLQRRSNISTSHLVPFLELTRISRASSEQRAGRAGRQAPGRALRLWTESEHRFMDEFETPEVQRTDPSQEILSLLDIGFKRSQELPWLDSPRVQTLAIVTHKLRALQLIENIPDTSDERLTALAQACLETSIELRWALFLEHLLRDAGYVDERSLLRACSSELGPRDKDGDLESLVDVKASLLRHGATYRAVQSALGSKFRSSPPISDNIVLKALTQAFLDRIARLRNGGESDKALMWGSRGIKLPQRARDEIHREDFLLAFDLDDSQHSNEDSRLRVYRWVPRKLIDSLFAARIREKTWAEKDSKTGALRFFRAKFLDDFAIQDAIPAAPDAAVLKEHRIQEILSSWKELEESESALGQLLRRLKLWGRSPTSDDVARVLSSLDTLPATAAQVADSGALCQALEGLFPYKDFSDFESRFPKSFPCPRDRNRALDYRVDGRVFLRTRLPDLFGLREHPSLDRGRLKIHVEILSPAQRPWQITQDIPNFWKSSYLEIRKEMKARYPRQPWPDDPSTTFE